MFSRLTRAAINRLKRLIVKYYNPTVSRKIYGRRLLVPLSHQLSYFLSVVPGYNQSLVTAVNDRLRRCGPIHTIVDVGANVGDTYALLSPNPLIKNFVLIEGDEGYYGLLAANVCDDEKVIAIKAILSDEIRGQSIRAVNGTGSIAGESSPGYSSANKMESQKFDDVVRNAKWHNPEGMKIDFIKIDTDGHDCRVIYGATESLKRWSPDVYWECDPKLNTVDDLLKCAGFLQEIGYTDFDVFDHIGNKIVSLACIESDMRKLREILEYAMKQKYLYYDLHFKHKR